MSVRNVSEDTLRLAPRTLAWDVDSLGVNVLSSPTNLDGGEPATWIHGVPDVLELPPNRNTVTRLRISPPETTNPREYFVALLYDDLGRPTPPAARLSRSQLLCLQAGNDLSAKIVLDDFRVEVEHPLLRVYCRISNSGQRRLLCWPKVAVSIENVLGDWNSIGRDVRLPSGDSTLLLPGHERVYRHEIAGLPAGSYRISLVAEFDDDSVKPLIRTRYFEVPAESAN